MPSALELAVLTILRPHFRIQDGARLVSAEGLEALATLSARDEAGQRRVQTMLRMVMAQHVDRPGWLHVFPVVPYALATLTWPRRKSIWLGSSVKCVSAS